MFTFLFICMLILTAMAAILLCITVEAFAVFFYVFCILGLAMFGLYSLLNNKKRRK